MRLTRILNLMVQWGQTPSVGGVKTAFMALKDAVVSQKVAGKADDASARTRKVKIKAFERALNKEGPIKKEILENLNAFATSNATTEGLSEKFQALGTEVSKLLTELAEAEMKHGVQVVQSNETGSVNDSAVENSPKKGNQSLPRSMDKHEMKNRMLPSDVTYGNEPNSTNGSGSENEPKLSKKERREKLRNKRLKARRCNFKGIVNGKFNNFGAAVENAALNPSDQSSKAIFEKLNSLVKNIPNGKANAMEEKILLDVLMNAPDEPGEELQKTFDKIAQKLSTDSMIKYLQDAENPEEGREITDDVLQSVCELRFEARLTDGCDTVDELVESYKQKLNTFGKAVANAANSPDDQSSMKTLQELDNFLNTIPDGKANPEQENILLDVLMNAPDNGSETAGDLYIKATTKLSNESMITLLADSPEFNDSDLELLCKARFEAGLEGNYESPKAMALDLAIAIDRKTDQNKLESGKLDRFTTELKSGTENEKKVANLKAKARIKQLAKMSAQIEQSKNLGGEISDSEKQFFNSVIDTLVEKDTVDEIGNFTLSDGDKSTLIRLRLYANDEFI